MSVSRFRSQVVPHDAEQEVGRVWIPWVQLVQGQVTGASTLLDGLGTGAPVSTGVLNSSLFNGMAVAADNDTFAYMWVLPQDFSASDLSSAGTNNVINIYPWCHLASASETGDGATWTCHYKSLNGTTDTIAATAVTTGVTEGAVTWTADDAAARASTPIALDVSAATTITSTSRALLLEIICSDLDGEGTTGFAANEQTLLGVEIEYFRRFL